jgi:endonuclease YncB( thermonuclease family)
MFSWFTGGFRVSREEIEVVDGDSIHWRRGGWGADGQQTEGAVKYRLKGYDSPEMGERAKSAREAEWAEDAKRYLQKAIANARKLRVKLDGNTPRGEPLAILYIDGVDTKDIMVAARMGVVPDWRDGRMIRPKWDELQRWPSGRTTR